MIRFLLWLTTTLALSVISVPLFAHGDNKSEPIKKTDAKKGIKPYQHATTGTRLFTWDSETVPGTLKILLDKTIMGQAGVEMAEVYFPPGWQGESHVHELEIFYVLEGELEHVVNSHTSVLKPGMVGVVKAPDTVVHRTKGGAKALIVWPLGKEVDGLAEVLDEVPLPTLRVP